MKKFYMMWSQCMENRLEAFLFKDYFMRNGMTAVGSPCEAEVIFIFTCGFTQEREDVSIKMIEQAQRNKKPNAEIIVCGCLTRINKDRIQRVFDGVLLAPYEANPLKEKFNLKGEFPATLPMSFQQNIRNKAPRRFMPFGYHHNASYLYHYYHWTGPLCIIKTSVGCLGQCSYCAVKIARSTLQSSPPEDVVDSIKEGKRRGFNNFILSTDDLGAYGKDLGTDYLDLLERIAVLNGNFKVDIRFLEPRWLIRDVKKIASIVRRRNFISFVCIPVQSGSEKILRAMRRDYNANECSEAMNLLGKSAPSTFVRLHLIAGFPEETDDDHRKNLYFLRKTQFDIGGVFIYSDRPGTEAAQMQGKVSPDIQKERFEELIRIIKTKTALRSVYKYYKYGYDTFFKQMPNGKN